MTLEHQAFMGPLEDAVPMTKHDPEKCFRVAIVMGAKPDPNRAGHPDEYQIVWPDGRIQTCKHVGSPEHWWSPDTDPADAWRVMEWAASRYEYRTFHNPWTVELWAPWSGGVNPDCMGAEAEEEGDTLMLALCNAVAALGGEE